ncbi:unknown [Phocaeicola plebeius CAG:211]|uniref:Uncharacterized protein n=1 Tax=Phocaeicola plebeius CAG:211 TaxID=1263052 RepID=R5VY50_9BACT|nr:unknown [Phocaeicola plebeius CAG:211]
MLNVGITHIDTNDNPSLGGITVNLQRTVLQVDAGHLADRYLDAFARADKQFVDIQVLHLILIQTQYEVETTFVFKDHSGSLSGVGRTDNRIQFLYVDAVAGNLGTVVFHQQLRKSHGLLYQHIGSSRHLFHILGRLFGLSIEFGHIFSIQFDGDIGFGSCHQLIETQLDGLAEIELGSLHRLQRLFHLLHHLRAAAGRSPFTERLHHNHHVGILYGHRVGRYFSRTDFGNHVLDFRKILLQFLLSRKRHLDTAAQGTTCRKRHLHGEVAFIECRNKFGSQPGEQQEGQY